MTTTGKLYLLASALAALAAIITAAEGGLVPDEHFRFGFLLAMAVALAWLGLRHRKPTD